VLYTRPLSIHIDFAESFFGDVRMIVCTVLYSMYVCMYVCILYYLKRGLEGSVCFESGWALFA